MNINHRFYNHISGNDSSDDNDDSNQDIGTVLERKTKIKRPSLYKVILLNDDYTPMEFVVMILQMLFNKTTEESAEITLMVHSKGIGICGVYPYDVAESKAQQVMDLARRNEHPLQCRIEKE